MGHEPLEEGEGHGEEEGPGADLRLRHQVCRGVELPAEDFHQFDKEYFHDDDDDDDDGDDDDDDDNDDDEEDDNEDEDDDTSRGTQSYECPAPALPCRADSENIKIFETLEAIEEKNILADYENF